MLTKFETKSARVKGGGGGSGARGLGVRGGAVTGDRAGGRGGRTGPWCGRRGGRAAGRSDLVAGYPVCRLSLARPRGSIIL